MRVLLIDDNEDDMILVRERIAEIAPDWTVEWAFRLSAGLSRASRGDIDVILLDLTLPDSQGLDTFRATRRITPQLPIVVMSGIDDEAVAEEAVRDGAQDYLVKDDLSAGVLVRALRYARERNRLLADLERQVEERTAAVRLYADIVRNTPLATTAWRLTNPNDAGSFRLLAANPAASQLAGAPFEQLLAQPLERSFPGLKGKDLAVGLMEVARTGKPKNFGEIRYTGESGTEQLLAVIAFPLTGDLVGLLCEEVTSRRKLEEQLRHSQKMDAVGQLAGGVAHDFNNVLTAIQSFGSFARSELPQEHPAYQDVCEILRAADRAADLVRQLLTFARNQPAEPRVLQLNELVQKLDRMMRRILGSDIDLVTFADAKLWMVEADPSQMEQVLINLAVNARDAMPRGGKLTIETANVRLDQTYVQQFPEAQAGDHVMFAVSDNGAGIDPAIQARIFEPFFTTKEKGRGTGLGLATCHGIVKAAGGHITLYSEVGRGTTFKVYLPRSYGEAADATPRTMDTDTRTAHETVLVVEDDSAVRQIAVRALRGAGYRVLEAKDGYDALGLCHSYAGQIHLMLTDVLMPRMNGRELAREAELVRPGMGVLYMSGYTDNAVVRHEVLEASASHLPKPFMPKKLVEKVRQVLELKEEQSS